MSRSIDRLTQPKKSLRKGLYTQTQTNPSAATVISTNTSVTSRKNDDDASLDAARNMLKQLSVQDDQNDTSIRYNDNKNTNGTTAVIITSNLSNNNNKKPTTGTFNKEQYYKMKLAPIDRPKTVFVTNTKSSLDRNDKDQLLRKLKITQNLYQGGGSLQNKLALQSSTFNPNIPSRAAVSITDSSYIVSKFRENKFKLSKT